MSNGNTLQMLRFKMEEIRQLTQDAGVELSTESRANLSALDSVVAGVEASIGEKAVNELGPEIAELVGRMLPDGLDRVTVKFERQTVTVKAENGTESTAEKWIATYVPNGGGKVATPKTANGGVRSPATHGSLTAGMFEYVSNGVFKLRDSELTVDVKQAQGIVKAAIEAAGHTTADSLGSFMWGLREKCREDIGKLK